MAARGCDARRRRPTRGRPTPPARGRRAGPAGCIRRSTDRTRGTYERGSFRRRSASTRRRSPSSRGHEAHGRSRGRPTGCGPHPSAQLLDLAGNSFGLRGRLQALVELGIVLHRMRQPFDGSPRTARRSCRECGEQRGRLEPVRRPPSGNRDGSARSRWAIGSCRSRVAARRNRGQSASPDRGARSAR